MQYLLPHKFVNLLAHLSANCKIVWVKNYLINYFIKRYSVNMSEAIEPNPFAYACYNDFFTRALKPECRPIAAAIDAIVSPADGKVAQYGRIKQQQIIQAKGHDYSVQDLLGGAADLAKKFSNGEFATVYLAPIDYHRVHMPYSGKLLKMIYVPGRLFSVNDHAAANIPNLFARNERVVCIFATDKGLMAVIMVGAMIVGSMETVWAKTITPPHTNKLKVYEYNQGEIELHKGQEMGRFKLGSTVIVLFESDAMQWRHTLQTGQAIKFGELLGTYNT